MRFEPVHLRWQDRLELQSPALKGRPETIEQLRTDLVDVCEHYVLPVLEECRDPLAAARFLERAETELRSRRLRHDEPRYKVFNPAIGTEDWFGIVNMRIPRSSGRSVHHVERLRAVPDLPDCQRTSLARSNSALFQRNPVDLVLRHRRDRAMALWAAQHLAFRL